MKYLFTLSCCAMLGIALSCECPTLTPGDTFVNGRTRNAALQEFNPAFNTATNTPDPFYSIEVFEFPDDPVSSGKLPAVLDVANGGFFTVERQFICEGRECVAVFSTQMPSNRAFEGDIMVVDVIFDPVSTLRRASLRFAGSLAQVVNNGNNCDPVLLQSVGADDFVNFVAAQSVNCENLRDSLSEYGRNLCPTKLGQPLTGNIDVFCDGERRDDCDIPAIILAEFDEYNLAFEVSVAIGEVYFYRAVNGVEYMVLIEDIFEGTQPPQLPGVKFKFTEVICSDFCDE